MIYNKNIDYWFTIEPYVYACRNKNVLLLFNTLDGSMIEANDEEVIELVESTLSEKNLSVLYFPGKRLEKKNLVDFINRLRKNFMGDIIDIQ